MKTFFSILLVVLSLPGVTWGTTSFGVHNDSSYSIAVTWYSAQNGSLIGGWPTIPVQGTQGPFVTSHPWVKIVCNGVTSWLAVYDGIYNFQGAGSPTLSTNCSKTVVMSNPLGIYQWVIYSISSNGNIQSYSEQLGPFESKTLSLTGSGAYCPITVVWRVGEGPILTSSTTSNVTTNSPSPYSDNGVINSYTGDRTSLLLPGYAGSSPVSSTATQNRVNNYSDILAAIHTLDDNSDSRSLELQNLLVNMAAADRAAANAALEEQAIVGRSIVEAVNGSGSNFVSAVESLEDQFTDNPTISGNYGFTNMLAPGWIGSGGADLPGNVGSVPPIGSEVFTLLLPLSSFHPELEDAGLDFGDTNFLEWSGPIRTFFTFTLVVSVCFMMLKLLGRVGSL